MQKTHDFVLTCGGSGGRKRKRRKIHCAKSRLREFYFEKQSGWMLFARLLGIARDKIWIQDVAMHTADYNESSNVN